MTTRGLFLLQESVLLKEIDTAMDHTIIVAAGAADPASTQYIAPYSGCTMGEYFRDRGEDAIETYDMMAAQRRGPAPVLAEVRPGTPVILDRTILAALVFEVDVTPHVARRKARRYRAECRFKDSSRGTQEIPQPLDRQVTPQRLERPRWLDKASVGLEHET